MSKQSMSEWVTDECVWLVLWVRDQWASEWPMSVWLVLWVSDQWVSEWPMSVFD
jgi:hypothetical protein